MKKSYLFFVIVSFIAIIGLGWYFFQGKQDSKEAVLGGVQAEVFMKPDVFEPETLTIKKGATVEFKNEDSQARWPASNIHPTHGIYPEFDPKEPVEPGKSWSFKFDKVGSWKYHDHLIPYIRGVIVVTE